MRVVIASHNPVKINATLSGFEKMFPGQSFNVEGISVESGVSAQPKSDAETLQGALNRADNASQKQPAADFWVGLEGGVEERAEGLTAFAWAVVKSKNQYGRGKTGTLFLPARVAELIKQGKELGEADDIVFNRTNSKQEGGAIGLLTGDVIDRTQSYATAIILALIPFKNGEFYD